MASTLAELEDELIFQQVLLDSLDPDSSSYEDDKAKIESDMAQIENSIASHDSSNTSNAPPITYPNLSVRPSSNNTPLLHAAVQKSAGVTPSNASKRPYNNLNSDNQASTPNGKRSRLGSPASSNSRVSLSSIDLTSGTQSRKDSALERHRRAEEDALRRASQAKLDREFALSLYGDVPGSSSSSVPRPNSQAVLNRDMSIRPQSGSQQMVVRPSNVQPSPSQFGVSSSFPGPQHNLGRIANQVPFQSAQLPTSRQLPWIKNEHRLQPNGGQSINSQSIANPSNHQLWVKDEASPSMAGPSRQPPTLVPHSSDEDSDLVEIDHNEFALNGGVPRPRQIPSQPLPSTQQPGLIQRGIDIYNRIVQGLNVPSQHPGISTSFSYPSMPGGFGVYSGPGQFGRVSDDLQILSNGSYQDIDPYTSIYNRAANVDSRFDYLYADNTKTAEELNALLENVRSDEDIPPELRKGTPEAMRVTLMEHQKLGLAWLEQQETGNNKGGILADDMGLGKTIQAIALMVTRRSQDPNRKTTLIVTPVSLMRQWEMEIFEKVKNDSKHRLTVYKYHGANNKKKSFNDLKKFDVVLTTYGSLAVELKKRDDWEATKKNNPNALPSEKEKLKLLGDDCKWYRIILDESQCIKNRDTKTARAAFILQAKHRLCMTGTPMMNNVTELYALIRFCRIKPYDNWERFRTDIKNPLGGGAVTEKSKETALKRLQSVVRAVMLRRTKKSKLDGKPLITLPDRETGRADVEFTQDEQDFYEALEKRQQMVFNKYMKEGTVLKNYAHVLILLLRLRQACCHPQLAIEFDSPSDVTAAEKMKYAKLLDSQTVQRIRDQGAAFECPICMDSSENPAIFYPCGHYTCTECFSRQTDPAQLVQQGGEEGAKAKCVMCRSPIDPKQVTDFMTFKKVHQRELLTQEELEAEGANDEEDDDDDSSDNSSDDDDDETNSLNGFVVKDDEDDEDESRVKTKKKGKAKKEESENEEDDDFTPVQSLIRGKRRVKDGDEDEDEISEAEEERRPSAFDKMKKGKGKAKRSFKGKDSGKGKGKKSGKKTFAQMKAEAMRSRKARNKYIRRLEKFYEPSSKIDRVMELIDSVQAEAPGEKILIFSQFTSLLDLAEIPLKHKYNYARYDGSMKPGERNDAVQYFKETPNCVAMLISLKAGNAGLNLNIANHVIILDPFWNPYIEEQAIDRAHRIGQTKTVKVHRVLVPGTVEDRIVTLQEQKRDLIEAALDENAGKQIGRLGVRELAYLFGVSRER